MKNMNEALKCIDKALEINPNLTDAYNNKGLFYLGLNQYKKSIKFFEKALELDSQCYNAYTNIEIAKKALSNYYEYVFISSLIFSLIFFILCYFNIISSQTFLTILFIEMFICFLQTTLGFSL